MPLWLHSSNIFATHIVHKEQLGDLYILMALIQFSNIQCQQCTLGKMILFISYCQLFHSEVFDKFDS